MQARFVALTNTYLLAALLGLLLAFWLFPVDFILGQGPYWTSPRGDVMKVLIGIRYFLADGWHLPLFDTRLIAPPQGISIIYTDSLPLFALIAKSLRPLLTERVNYFGIWFLVTYLLQGVAAVFLFRSLGVYGVLTNLAGAIIALSFPAFLFRFDHATLCGHFLILFALGLHFRIVRQQAFSRLWMWLAALCWLALLVHGYLFVMVFGVFLATTAQQAFSPETRFRKSLIAGAIGTGVSGLLMWASGYFHHAGSSWGFRHFSMNVLSPWVPQRSGLFPGMDRVIDATGGQYEGFNYLGCGVLLLLGAAIWVGRAEIRSAIGKHSGLSLLLAGLTLLAITNRVFIGEWEALRIGGSRAFLEQFRASGRFFWPVGYTLMAIGLAVVASRFRRPFGTVLVMTAAILQFVDAGPLRHSVAVSARSGQPFVLSPEPWRTLIPAHNRLTVIPSFYCVPGPWEEPLRWAVLELVFHASLTATPANTVYLARTPAALDCGRENASLQGYDLRTDELLVVFSPPISRREVVSVRSSNQLCRSFHAGFACSHQWSALEGAKPIPGFSSPVIDALPRADSTLSPRPRS